MLTKNNLLLPIFITISCAASAQLKIPDFKNFDLRNIIGKTLKVKRGFAPKFSLGNLNLAKITQVAKVINLKNIGEANRLFNTFKTGRALYRGAALTSTVLSTYSVIKNTIQTNKAANTVELQEARRQGIASAQKLLVSGGATIGIGLLIKFITKRAAYKATDAFNGMVRKKLTDILSIDSPTQSPYASTGLALKIKL